MKLTREQIAFFKDNGYLILKNALDVQSCAGAQDRKWAELPENCRLKREDPATHIGPFADEDVQDDALHMRKDFRWQIRQFGTEQWLVDLVYTKDLIEVAEQLLGEGLIEPPIVGGKPMGSDGPAWPGGPVDPAVNEGVRGIYCTLPYGDRPREPESSHTDGHPFCLGIVGLIDDVPPDGGAFRIWPGSHRRLYPTCQMQYDQPRVPFYEHMPSHKGIVHTPEYLRELEAIMSDTPSVDCWGQQGDVVLWHHRLAHMAGHNYSQVIRQAVLHDFNRKDLDLLRLDPPQQDMWRDWSSEVRATETRYSKTFAEEQRLPAKLLEKTA